MTAPNQQGAWGHGLATLSEPSDRVLDTWFPDPVLDAGDGEPGTRIVARDEAPPELGGAYASSFRRVYRDLARQYDVTLIPFLLDGVAGRMELNQPDRIHPTAEGARIVSETVWAALRPHLKNKSS